MDNIGYAIFKKASVLTIDSNGMFEDLQLPNDLNSLIPLIKVGQQLLCFKRVASRKSNLSNKDACLVILVERFNNSNKNFVLGSAICFKEYVVNEAKIIDGVRYLLNQLKRNFKNDYDIEGEDLGVLLPSTKKDFKIFKTEKLIQLSSNPNLLGFDTISFTSNDAKSFLHYFQKHKTLSHISSLLLSDKMISGIPEGKAIKPIQVKTLIQLKQIESSKSLNQNLEKQQSKTTINNGIVENDEILKNRNLFRALSIVFFCFSVILATLLMTINNKPINKSTDNSIYEIGDDLYISYNSYNVNVRSSPNTDYGDSNVKNTLSDGDKIYLLGFDKETLWAKIRYDENNEIGYVSNRLLSKQIATNRVQPVYKKAVINYSYSGAPIYTSPAEIVNNIPDVITYLQENHNILVKNKDLRLNSYSVSFKKNNKTYHGYIERKYFNYQ